METNLAIPMKYVNYKFQQNQQKAKSNQKKKSSSEKDTQEVQELEGSVFTENKTVWEYTPITSAIQIKLDNTLRETIKYLRTKGHTIKTEPLIEEILNDKPEEPVPTDIFDLEIDYTKNIFAA